MTDHELARRIREAALLHGHFTLRSGRTSRYYLDKYRFTTQPDILAELGRRIAAHVDDSIDRLAGPELGGVPLVTAAALETGKPFVLIRNAKKDYGTAQQIEGVLEAGERIIITEDIVTSGGQALEAARLLRDELQIDVARVIAVVDRQEGGREKIEAEGFAFTALLTSADLGIET